MTGEVTLREGDRNPVFMDWWSLTHLAWGAFLVLLMEPFWALAVMVLWEPVEILLIAPLAARFGIRFGHETLRNSLMDVVFDVVGVLMGMWLVVPLVELLMS